MPFEREGGPPPEAMEWRAPVDTDVPQPETSESAAPHENVTPTEAEPSTPPDESPHESAAASVAAAERPLTPEEKIEKALEKHRAEFGAEFDAEVEKVRDGVEADIRTGIAKLYELLQLAKRPNDQLPEEKHFSALVDAAGKLAEMPLGMRHVLYTELKRDKKFRNAELPEFSQHCRSVISLWADMEALKLAADNVLDRRHGARPKPMPEQSESSQPPGAPLAA